MAATYSDMDSNPLIATLYLIATSCGKPDRPSGGFGGKFFGLDFL